MTKAGDSIKTRSPHRQRSCDFRRRLRRFSVNDLFAYRDSLTVSMAAIIRLLRRAGFDRSWVTKAPRTEVGIAGP